MVNILVRMHKLRSLLSVRVGPGAAIFPPEVTRIHMDFATEIRDGNRGPKQFWRHCLPRLKYYNPAVPMTINRTDNPEGPALMTISFKSPEAAATTPETSTTSKNTSAEPVPESESGAIGERTETIDMKHREDSEILASLLQLTKAKVVKPTQEELQQIREVEEWNAVLAKEAQQNAEFLTKKKREEAILIQARGEVDKII